MPITDLETAIAAAGIVSECLLLLAWAVRGRKSPFWLLGLYATYHLSFSVSLLVLHLRTRSLSDLMYYSDYAIDFALLSGVIAEMFIYTFRPFVAWPGRIRLYLSWGLILGTLLPILIVLSLRFVGFTRSTSWDNRLDLLSSLLLCTFLLISAWTEVQLCVHKDAKVGEIRWGLVSWSALTLIINLSHMNQGWSVSNVFNTVSNAFWVIMLLSWTRTVWTSNRSSNSIDVQPHLPGAVS